MNKIKRVSVGFAQIKNEVLCDPDISMKAKCMFAYIYSKPEEWDFSVHRVVKEMKEGKESINNALRELEHAGYLVRKRLKSGKMQYFCSYNKPDTQNWHEALEAQCQKPLVPETQIRVSRTVSNTNNNKHLNINNTEAKSKKIKDGMTYTLKDGTVAVRRFGKWEDSYSGADLQGSYLDELACL